MRRDQTFHSHVGLTLSLFVGDPAAAYARSLALRYRRYIRADAIESQPGSPGSPDYLQELMQLMRRLTGRILARACSIEEDHRVRPGPMYVN